MAVWPVQVPRLVVLESCLTAECGVWPPRRASLGLAAVGASDSISVEPMACHS